MKSKVNWFQNLLIMTNFSPDINILKNCIPEYLIKSEVYAVVCINITGEINYANDHFLESFKRLKGEVLPMNFLSLCSPYELEKAKTSLEDLSKNKISLVNISFSPEQKERGLNFMNWEFSLLEVDNQPISLLGIGNSNSVSDFSDLYVNETLEKITDGYIFLDRDWKLIRTNKLAEIFLGSADSSWQNKTIWDAISTDMDAKASLELNKAMDENTTANFEIFRTNLNQWFSFIAYPNPVGLLLFLRDTTRERTNVELLKISKNKLRAILNSTSDSIVFLSLNYEIVDCNRVAQEISKYTLNRELVIGENFLDYLENEGRTNFLELFPLAIKGEVTSKEILRKYKTDLRWFETTMNPVLDDDGSILGVTINTVDIDQRKRVEERLRSSENKLRAILDSSTDTHILIDANYKILSFNRRANENSILTIGKPLIENKSIWEYILPDDKDDFYISTQRALDGEVLEFEKNIDFGKFTNWYDVGFYPVYDSDNKIIGFTFSTTDIENRKQAESKILESETMLKAIYNSISESSTFIDKDYRIIFTNQLTKEVCFSLFGKTPQKGDISLDYIVPQYKNELIKLFEQVIEGKNIVDDRLYLNKWWKISMYPVYNSTDEIIGISINIKDNTEKKLSEIQILKQNERLRKIAWQQSHEVRRPVANILGICEMLKADREAFKEDLDKYLDYLTTATQELDRIIHSIVENSNDI